jgi:hypothetical protein
LSEYTEYKFKIQACNEAGEGPESDIYTFTTTKSPPTALKGKWHTKTLTILLVLPGNMN